MKTIAIYCKQKPSVSTEVVTDVTRWLRDRKRTVLFDRQTAKLIGETSTYERAELPPLADLIIVLGGDGTLLSVARIAHPYDVPILAVNLGSLGFLTEVTLDEVYRTLEIILAGECHIEQRMLLNARLWRGNDLVGDYHVLNDVVINKGVVARIVNLQVLVNGQYMTSYRADGLIIATPTGSTAYNLSAGGPIIYPSMHALVLSPICPFALTNRSILIPDNSTIEVQLTTEKGDVRVTLDGQEGCDMHTDDKLEVKKADTTLKLVQAPGKNYYQILRKKLQWGSSGDTVPESS